MPIEPAAIAEPAITAHDLAACADGLTPSGHLTCAVTFCICGPK
jgi:hypothetical protein